jgi:uncharacterized membrane protein required for colicin V production
MVYDLLALAVLLVFAALGAMRGALASGLGLATLLLAYLLSVALASPLAPHVARASGVSGFFAVPLAGTLVFVAVVALGTLASSIYRGIRRRRYRPLPPTWTDRFGGALFGAARGVFVVLALGLLAIWLDAARGEAAAPPPLVARATRAAVQEGAAVLGANGAGTRLLVETAVDPREAMGRMQAVLADPKVMALRDDPGFWDAVEQGDVDGAMDRPSFAAMAEDEALRGRLAGLGLVDPSAAQDPDAFHQEVAKALRAAGPRIHALRSDPAFQSLTQDPELARLAQQGDTMALLARPEFQKLVAHVLEAAHTPAE